ncbi:MAG: ABC transporter permease [Crocinitomicaceae bacterium]|nr:ABC transporter permease [Crocinitomicaceae bacterium]|tara:strand:+ start:460 stop:1680 length:1221 start_codon:yes stop_codon:yes gene_type:complete
MRTIFKIAWRNIWRNRLRSLVVIGSIVLGIWSGIFVGAFSFGMNTQRTKNTIKNNISHLQIHHKKWAKEHKLNYWIEDPKSIENYLTNSKAVKHFSSRILINGMVASAHKTAGVQITGINPEQEAQLTDLASKIDSGNYISDKGKNSILIGEALAEKMKVKPGSKVVITFTDSDGNIISSAFKIRGFFNVTSSTLEKSMVYVRNSDLEKLLNRTESAHEFALLLNNEDQVESFHDELQQHFPNYRVQTWKEVAPELAYADDMMSTMLYIIIGIIILALSFGIVNTMLMAVLERKKELGMLMGIGMSKTRIFLMILFETLLLSLCGGPLGVILSYASIALSHQTGIDLSFFGAGLQSLGIDSVIYPEVMTSFYFGTGGLVVVMAIISSIWPARRALKMNPVEAIRTI